MDRAKGSESPFLLMVREFHQSFSHPVSHVPVAINEQRKVARVDWLFEEVRELQDSTTIVEQVDALIDIMYFAYGTLVEMGVPDVEAFSAVHNANMRKLDEHGRPLFSKSGKISKPSGWVGPEVEIRSFLVSLAIKKFLGHTVDASEYISSGLDCLICCVKLVVDRQYGPSRSTNLREFWLLLHGENALAETADLALGLAIDEANWNGKASMLSTGVQFNYARINYLQEWDFDELFDSLVDQGRLPILTLSAGKLLGHERLDVGHAIILVSRVGDEVTIFDTAEDHFGYFKYSRTLLIDSCRARLGGLLTIEPSDGAASHS